MHFTIIKAYHHAHVALLCAGIFTCILSGCTTAPQPNSIQQLESDLNKTHPDVSLQKFSIDYAFQKSAELESLLAQPLTPRTAVQIMLLNSPEIEIELAKLGISDAAHLQATLISSPRLSFAILKPENGENWLWDLGLSQPLMEFLTRSKRKQQADSEIIITQLEVTRLLQSQINELEQTYFSALATKQNLDIQNSIVDAAIAKKELAESLYRAGNISELTYLEHLADLQEQQHVLGTRKSGAQQTVDELAYRLGLNAVKFELPKTMPGMPQEIFYAPKLIEEAVTHRVDVQLARRHIENFDAQIALVNKEYGLADASIGIAAAQEADGTRSAGPQVEMPIPLFGTSILGTSIFDRGQAKIASLRAQADRSKAELRLVSNAVARDIQYAVNALEAARYEFTQLNDAQKTSDKRVLLLQREVNFMLASPFELIELKAENIQLQHEQTSALLSYWQARSQLELALGQRIPFDAAKEIEESRHDTHEGHSQIDEEKTTTTPINSSHDHHHIMSDDKSKSGASNHD